MKEYVIPVHGLKTGIHNYEFEVDRSFFESFESDVFENPEILINLRLEKTSTMLLLDFSAHGSSELPCDRCGSPMSFKVDCADKAIVKFSDEPIEDADEIITLSPQEHELDLSDRIYEMLVLNIPPKNVHERLEDCDQEALERLREFEGKDDDHIDPRWDALKKLK